MSKLTDLLSQQEYTYNEATCVKILGACVNARREREKYGIQDRHIDGDGHILMRGFAQRYAPVDMRSSAYTEFIVNGLECIGAITKVVGKRGRYAIAAEVFETPELQRNYLPDAVIPTTRSALGRAKVAIHKSHLARRK